MKYYTPVPFFHIPGRERIRTQGLPAYAFWSPDEEVDVREIIDALRALYPNTKKFYLGDHLENDIFVATPFRQLPFMRAWAPFDRDNLYYIPDIHAETPLVLPVNREAQYAKCSRTERLMGAGFCPCPDDGGDCAKTLLWPRFGLTKETAVGPYNGYFYWRGTQPRTAGVFTAYSAAKVNSTLHGRTLRPGWAYFDFSERGRAEIAEERRRRAAKGRRTLQLRQEMCASCQFKPCTGEQTRDCSGPPTKEDLDRACDQLGAVWKQPAGFTPEQVAMLIHHSGRVVLADLRTPKKRDAVLGYFDHDGSYTVSAFNTRDSTCRLFHNWEHLLNNVPEVATLAPAPLPSPEALRVYAGITREVWRQSRGWGRRATYRLRTVNILDSGAYQFAYRGYGLGGYWHPDHDDITLKLFEHLNGEPSSARFR